MFCVSPSYVPDLAFLTRCAYPPRCAGPEIGHGRPERADAQMSTFRPVLDPFRDAVMVRQDRAADLVAWWPQRTPAVLTLRHAGREYGVVGGALVVLDIEPR
jgi:hypothetical protein